MAEGTEGSVDRPDWWPIPSSDAVTKVMRGNHRVDTAPEIRVRRELHRRGLRYRVDHTIRYPGSWTRPDVVFTRSRVAVYIDGCFWHGCPQHYTRPAANRGYWSAKVERNRARDRRASTALREMGWTVLRFWEHMDSAEVVDVVQIVVEQRRAATRVGST